MTANKHTPGPWEVVVNYGDLTVRSANARDTQDATYLEIVSEVGGLRTGLQCLDWSEELANARLIAAAPELLDLVRELWSDVRDNSEEDEPYGRRVRDVIAKATGDSP